MKVAVVSASPRPQSATQHMMRLAHERASEREDSTFVNLAEIRMDCFRGHGEQYGEQTLRAARTMTEADVWLIGTPVYNSFFSGALKNLAEYLDYKKTPGKTAGLAVMASGQIGFTNVQTLLTQMMSYFGAVTNPKAVFMTADGVSGGRVSDPDARRRVEELVDSTLALAYKVSA